MPLTHYSYTSRTRQRGKNVSGVIPEVTPGCPHSQRRRFEARLCCRSSLLGFHSPRLQAHRGREHSCYAGRTRHLPCSTGHLPAELLCIKDSLCTGFLDSPNVIHAFRLLKCSVIVITSAEVSKHVSLGKIQVIAKVFFCLFCSFHYFLLLAMGGSLFCQNYYTARMTKLSSTLRR